MSMFAVLSGRGVSVEMDADVTLEGGIEGNVVQVHLDDAAEFAASLDPEERYKLRAALQVARLTDDLDATVRELTPRGLRDVIRAATDALMEAAAND